MQPKANNQSSNAHLGDTDTMYNNVRINIVYAYDSICIYIYIYLSLSLSIYLFIYLFVYLVHYIYIYCMYVCMYECMIMYVSNVTYIIM